jgi:signal transduction histidine kinase
MKIWQRFIGSSALVAGLICLMGGRVVVLYQAETAAETTQKKTEQALTLAIRLEKSLKDQSLALKDFVVLDHNASNMVEYQKTMSNFLIDLDSLERSMDKAPELSLVRRRHAFLIRLANSLDNNPTTFMASQQDLKAINSYAKDITFYLTALSENAQQQNYLANQKISQLRKINTNLMFIGITGIFLVFVAQFILILIPVIRSLHKLQLGVATIGTGNLNYRLHIKTGDEIEQLANEFNQMTVKLSDFYDSLEFKVAERTAELFQANKELEYEIAERRQAEANLQQSQTQLRQKAQELEQTLHELQQTQTQLIQTEKMSSLGQLVAGVAHEINNPVNFIHGNITHINEYVHQLIKLLQMYHAYYPQPADEIQYHIEEIDLDFIIEDATKILSSIHLGTKRIREIVLSLRNFSRLDESDMKEVNIHEGIDSTLLILQHRLKPQAKCSEIEIIKAYGELPLIECYAGQLNQVFMNILNNAIDALEEQNNQQSSQDITNCSRKIFIQTQLLDKERIAIHIADNGIGIPEAIRSRIFDPFFTTKPVGQGTGLGLSISYQIVTARHKGCLKCLARPEHGTEMIIELPIWQHDS